MSLDDSTRCLRRTWDQNKSHLPKYNSLPELQLIVKERPLYHCRQCGFTSSLINPMCLWCTWTCKEAKNEFKSPMPRARRASAPPRVFIRIDLSPASGKFTLLADGHANIDSNQSVVSSRRTETNAKSFVIDLPPSVPSVSSYMPIHQSLVDATVVYDRCINSHRDHIYDININDPMRQRELHLVPATSEGFSDITTATCSQSSTSLHSSSQTSTLTVERVERNPEGNNSVRIDTADASRTLPLISERTSSAPFRLGGVDCSYSESTTAVKPNKALKVSRRAFNVGRADKMPFFHLDDAHKYAKDVPLNHDETTPSPIKSAPSSKHQNSRPLRRKNHLHIVPSYPDSGASEPIAISLTLHHSPPQILTDYISPHPHTRAHSHPQSIVASVSSSTSDPVTPPMTPTHQRLPPSSAPPKMKSAGTPDRSSPELSPVRLGHPSRPYYNAIRKNGISPSPSRTRPQSQPPPSSFHLGFDLTPSVATSAPTTVMTSPSRRLSMLASPPPFSALSLIDDGDDNNFDGAFEVHSGPTNSARLSLSSSLHRLSYDAQAQNHAHHAQSLSRAKGRSSGIGFSMSGETELRMALATFSPSGVATLGRTTEGGFRFRETVTSSENITNHDNVDSTNAGTEYPHAPNVRSRDSFMGRVKKLRKGLKEMLMNKNTTTATSATT